MKSKFGIRNAFLAFAMLLAALDFWRWIAGSSYAYLFSSLSLLIAIMVILFGGMQSAKVGATSALILLVIYRVFYIFLINLENAELAVFDAGSRFSIAISIAKIVLPFVPAVFAIIAIKAEFGRFGAFLKNIESAKFLAALYASFVLFPLLVVGADPSFMGDFNLWYFIVLSVVQLKLIPTILTLLLGYALVKWRFTKTILLLPLASIMSFAIWSMDFIQFAASSRVLLLEASPLFTIGSQIFFIILPNYFGVVMHSGN